MQKLKSINLKGILQILKACLFGIVITLIGIVVFAIILKFADLPSGVVGYVNDIIKAISLFFVVLVLKKQNGEKLLIRAIVAGLIYAVLTFVIFSILNGGFSFNLSIIYDILFALIVALIVTVILNIVARKN